MTMAILVLVLFFVYPLKFLFTLVTVNVFQLAMHDRRTWRRPRRATCCTSSTAWASRACGACMRCCTATRCASARSLQLTPIELLQTRGSLCEYLVHIGVCALSITLAFTTDNNSLPGFIYFLIGPAQSLVGWYFGRQYRALEQQIKAG